MSNSNQEMQSPSPIKLGLRGRRGAIPGQMESININVDGNLNDIRSMRSGRTKNSSKTHKTNKSKRQKREKKRRQRQRQDQKDKKLKDVYDKMKALSLFHASILIIGIILAVLANDLIDLDKKFIPASAQILRTVNSISCIPLLYLVYEHYKLDLEVKKQRKQIYHKTTLWQSPTFKWFIAECLMNLIHVPPSPLISIPSYSTTYKWEATLDSYVSAVMLLRTYILLRLFKDRSKWTSARSYRICKMNGFEPDSLFAIRAYMKSSPQLFLLFCCTLSIIIFGVAVRNFEYPLYEEAPSSVNFQSYQNSFWCMVLTMTTVGYGDIFPITHIGRLTTILACIWGMFIMSTIIVTLTNIITLTNEEEAAYNSLERTKESNNKLKPDAARFILYYWRYYYAKIKDYDRRKRLKARSDYITVKERFHFKRMMVLHSNPKIEEAIESLSTTVYDYLKNGSKKIKILKDDVGKQVCEMRQNQYKIDVQMLKLYDNTLKINSFLCLSNMLSKCEYDNLDKLKFHFDPKGKKNNHIKTKHFVKEFYNARKPLKDFFKSIEEAKEILSPQRVRSPGVRSRKSSEKNSVA